MLKLKQERKRDYSFQNIFLNHQTTPVFYYWYLFYIFYLFEI